MIIRPLTCIFIDIRSGDESIPISLGFILFVCCCHIFTCVGYVPIIGPIWLQLVQLNQISRRPKILSLVFASLHTAGFFWRKHAVILWYWCGDIPAGQNLCKVFIQETIFSYCNKMPKVCALRAWCCFLPHWFAGALNLFGWYPWVKFHCCIGSL